MSCELVSTGIPILRPPVGLRPEASNKKKKGQAARTSSLQSSAHASSQPTAAPCSPDPTQPGAHSAAVISSGREGCVDTLLKV